MKRYLCIAMTAAMLMVPAVLGTATVPSLAAAKVKEVKINKKNFPDEVFRELVKANYDKNKDNKLSVKEIKKAKKFGTGSCKNTVMTKKSKYSKYQKKGISQIKSFKGIEKLVYLKSFVANETSVKSINVKKNPRLVYFEMECGQLKSLDLNKNTKLKYVYLKYNKLTSLKLNKCKKLVTLDVTGHMVKNLKIDRNKKTEVIGEDYYRPYTVSSVKMTENELTRSTLDASGNYCVYEWAQDRSNCVKHIWDGTRMTDTTVLLDANAQGKAKAAQTITTQWEDASGNFYFVADVNGELANQSKVYIYKVNPQGNLQKEMLLNDQITLTDTSKFDVIYLNQSGNSVQLALNGTYFSSLIEFDQEEMITKKQATYSGYEQVVAAEGDLFVLKDEYGYSGYIYVGKITDGEKKELPSGHILEVSQISTSTSVYVPASQETADAKNHSSVYIKKGTVYAVSGLGLFKLKITSKEKKFQQIYTVSNFNHLYEDNVDFCLVMKSEKEISVFTRVESDDKTDYSFQVGTIR